MFAHLVRKWADRREEDINCGERPTSDMELVVEARACAHAGEQWRRNNYGKWRTPRDHGMEAVERELRPFLSNGLRTIPEKISS
jgi:hypothetical protein